MAESTIEDWERTLRNWINPHIGDCPVSEVNNSVLKRLVVVMSNAGLSAKTIENYIRVPKMVVAAVLDEDGTQVYPRKWNHDFIDMPIVEESEQNRPSLSSEIMTGLAHYHRPREQMIFIVSGAGGLRIGETLGIEIDKHLSADCSTISIEQKARRGRVENRVKTRSAKRQVDLYPDVAKLLKSFIGTRTWLGHAGNSIDDLYDRVKDNAVLRKQRAKEYGIGFELPNSVSIVPKNSAKTKTKKAA